jgi:hypothetical protein
LVVKAASNYVSPISALILDLVAEIENKLPVLAGQVLIRSLVYLTLVNTTANGDN